MSQKENTSLIDSLRSLEECEQRNLTRLLKNLEGRDEDILAFAASLLVCAHRRNEHRPEWLPKAFDILVKSQSPLAFTFLKHAAREALIAGVRVEALKSLKSRELEERTIKLVHEYATTGAPQDKKLFQFQSESISDIDFRVAAVNVLSEPESRNQNSVDVVWSVLDETIANQAGQEELYDAAVECLRKMADLHYSARLWTNWLRSARDLSSSTFSVFLEVKILLSYRKKRNK